MYVLVSGGFDPLHSGHIKMFKAAAEIGKLIVAVNSDKWLVRKKGTFLLPRVERSAVIQNLKMVDSVLSYWDDTDNSSVGALKQFYSRFGMGTVFFANGGDVTEDRANKLEIDFCKQYGIHPLYNVGGGKEASSSNFYARSLQRMSSDNLLKLLN